MAVPRRLPGLGRCADSSPRWPDPPPRSRRGTVSARSGTLPMWRGLLVMIPRGRMASDARKAPPMRYLLLSIVFAYLLYGSMGHRGMWWAFGSAALLLYLLLLFVWRGIHAC